MNCPACHLQLSVGFEMADNEFVAWCSHGPCPSYKANDGARGRTEEVAMQNLIKLLESDPDWSKE